MRVTTTWVSHPSTRLLPRTCLRSSNNPVSIRNQRATNQPISPCYPIYHYLHGWQSRTEFEDLLPGQNEGPRGTSKTQTATGRFGLDWVGMDWIGKGKKLLKTTFG